MAKLERYYHATHLVIDLDHDYPMGKSMVSCIIEYQGKPWRVIEKAKLVEFSIALGLPKIIIQFDRDEDDLNFKTNRMALFIESEDDIEEIHTNALTQEAECYLDLFLSSRHQLTRNTAISEHPVEVITIEDGRLAEIENDTSTFRLSGHVYKDTAVISVSMDVFKSTDHRAVKEGKVVEAFIVDTSRFEPDCFGKTMVALVKNWDVNYKVKTESVLAKVRAWDEYWAKMDAGEDCEEPDFSKVNNSNNNNN